MPHDIKPTITITVYGISFCLLNNNTVLSKREGGEWEQKSARELDLQDGHLGAIRHLITNVRGLFPDKAPSVAKVEPPKEEVRRSSLQAV